MNFVDWFIQWIENRPYRKGHLYHADNSLYMKRYSIFETKWLSARVHNIATEDRDVAMHDHPWSFISFVLRGAYLEERPMTIMPCFISDSCEESYGVKARRAGLKPAFRHATDRHRISWVAPNTWTLFIYGPLRQWWGFYTPAGKIYFRDYLQSGSAFSPLNDIGEDLG